MEQVEGKTSRVGRIIIGSLMINTATFTFASNYVLGRWMRADIGPITLTAARFVIASAILVFIWGRLPYPERRIDLDRGLLLFMSFTGLTLFCPLLYWGLHYTSSANAALITGVAPLLTIVISSFVHRLPLSKAQVGGALIGLTGVWFVISGGNLPWRQASSPNWGDLLVLTAMFLWSLYSVAGRTATQRRSAVSVTAWGAFLSLPFLLPASALETSINGLHLTAPALVAIIYIGIFPSVIGYLAWNGGVHRLGPGRAMMFFNTLPLYGAILGAVCLGESIGLGHVVGGALIVTGAIIGVRAGI